MSVTQPPSASGPKFRVAICGAGIGGLVLAITIGKYDPSIPVDLYEAHDSIDTAGVGISIWSKTHEVLVDLGLFDEFKGIFTNDPERSPAPYIRRADIREGGYFWFPRDRGIVPSAMHRQHMVAILEKNLPASCKVHPGRRLVKYIEPDGYSSEAPIRLEFADGTTATTDVFIGADGVRSVVRKTMFEAASKESEANLQQYVDATFTGMVVHRFLIPVEVLRKESPEHQSLKGMTSYVGKGKNLFTYPIAKGAVINCAVTTGDPSLTGTHYEGHWVSDGTRDELIEHFKDFEPDVRTVLKLCEKPSKWALHTVKPLPFCVRNRVALIGDAAHAMTPHFGAGAVQAIDDAFILGRLIAHPLVSYPRIRDALHLYQEIRLPIGTSVASLSVSTGWLYVLMAPGYYDGTRTGDDLDEHGIGSHEREGMEAIKQEILRRTDGLNELKSAPQTWQDAESKLQALVTQTEK